MELSQAYATRIKQLMKENHVNLYKLSKLSGISKAIKKARCPRNTSNGRNC
ncbi:MAG: hypothetical protein ACLRTQ_05810 [Candidatus Borkfalkia sp.]